MIIREANKEDLSGIIPLLKEFCTESLAEYGAYIKPQHIILMADKYLANTLVVEIDDNIVGVISGVIVDLPVNGEKAYQEVVWFITKKYRRYGIRLYNAIETRCRERGIRFILMVSMDNSKAEELDRFYKKIGFRLTERQYMKDLGGR